MEHDKYNGVVSTDFLRMSVFTALTIFVLVLTTMFLANMVSASCYDYDCDSCDTYDSCDTCSDCDWCDDGYTDQYRCSDNKKQRLWINDDCTREWRIIETCVNGCREGRCLSCPIVVGEVSPSRPSDRFEGETAYTSIKIRNTDDEGHWYDLIVYVCKSKCTTLCSTSDCREMLCDIGRVYVQAGQTKHVRCSKFMPSDGYYRIKVEYKVDSRVERSVYSDRFRVIDDRGVDDDCDSCDDCYDWESCDGDGCKEYRCFGKFLQKRYKNENCEWRWEIVEQCPYGCENDKCVLPTGDAKTSNVGEPKVFVRPSYEMGKCELTSFTFSVQNNGQSDTFVIKAEGNAADWIDIPQIVEIDKGETKSVTGYASIPCDATSGMHDFTVTASAKTSDSTKSFIKVEKPTGLFILSPFTDLLLVVVVIVIFVVVIWYRDKIGFASLGSGKRPWHKIPETFNRINKLNKPNKSI